MILSMTFQCKLFFLSAALGALGGFAYSIIYTAQAEFGTGKLVKGISDLLFWLIFALFVFLVMLRVNYGEIRPFAVLGTAAGMLIYHLTLSPYANRAMKVVYKIIYKLLALAVEILLTPFKLLLYPLKMPLNYLKKLFLRLKKACNKVKSMRK